MKKILKRIPVILSVLFFLLWLSECERRLSRGNSNKELTDSISYAYDQLGRETATRKVLELRLKNFREAFQEERLSNKLLKEKLSKKTTQATFISISTNDNSSGVTTIVKSDTVYKDSLIYIYPAYTSSIVKDWAKYELYMDKDSSNVISQIYNDIFFTLRKEKKQTYVDVTNLNPNTGTKQLRSVQLPRKKTHIGIKIAVLVATFLAGTRL